MGYNAQGDPYGPPVLISQANSTGFSLAVTDNEVVIICLRGRAIVEAYLTNGVPHASIELQAVEHGRAGLFVPISAPVIYRVIIRLYLLQAI